MLRLLNNYFGSLNYYVESIIEKLG